MNDSPKVGEARASRLEVLLSRQRPWLLIQARNLCRNAADAEDLVQETLVRFLAAFGQVETLPSESACGSWLVTTLTHCFYDQLRRQRTRERGAVDPALAGQAEVGSESAQRPLYDRISEEQFSAAVQELSPRIRTTFELHASGRRYQDIAQELGVPSGTVAKRLHDARLKLRKLLEPYIQSGDN